MRILTNDQALRRAVPNVLPTVAGELSLFEKIKSYINVAETKFARSILPLAMLDEEPEDSDIRELAEHIVATSALAMALPALDLVLTPNGFGIVSNQNVAPASKERVERLIASLKEERDASIGALLHILRESAEWRASGPGQYFGQILFFGYDLPKANGETSGLWDAYQQLLPSARAAEDALAEDYYSRDLLEALRAESLAGTLTNQRAWVVAEIKAQTLDSMSCTPPSRRRISATIDFIRKSEEHFPEWHASEIALLFIPKNYENRKDDAGYWF